MVTDPFIKYLESKYIRRFLETRTLRSSEEARDLIGHYLMAYNSKETLKLVKHFERDVFKVNSVTTQVDFEVTDGDDLSRLIRDHLVKKPKCITSIRELFNRRADEVIDRNDKYIKSASYARLQKLKDTFLLSDVELSIVEFFFMKEASSVFDDVRLSDLDESVVKSGKLLARMFDCRLKSIRDAFSKQGALFRSCLIEQTHRGSLSLDDYTVSYISGYESTPVPERHLKRDTLKTTFKLDEFSLPNRDLKAVKLLLDTKRPGNKVLLYGKPGTGKTEFTRALSKHLNRDLYIIRAGENDGEDSLKQRQRAVVASQNVFRTSRPIVLVDESDSILNTTHSYFDCEKNSDADAKAWINTVLENDSVDMIWISNRTSGVDDSTKRRFNYALEFEDLTVEQRKKIWEISQSNSHKLFSESEMEQLAENYTVNAGSVGIAYKSAESLPKGTSRKDRKELVKSIVSNHNKFIYPDKSDKLSVTNFYDPDVVATDRPVQDIIDTLGEFYKFLESEWGDTPAISNINLLFSGASGTGKTEFAKYVAKTLGKKLLQKNASDLFDKYVGETEQKIAQMFKQAEREKAILFLDEADSLFTSREAATQSWQVAWTNELLVQMEKFKGVLICSTNFLDNLDTASMRRFNMKVRFDSLATDGKVSLFKSMLTTLTGEDMDKEQELLIGAIPNLTVGDFKTVYQRNFFLKGITNHYLIEELKLEVSYKGKGSRKIGL